MHEWSSTWSRGQGRCERKRGSRRRRVKGQACHVGVYPPARLGCNVGGSLFTFRQSESLCPETCHNAKKQPKKPEPRVYQGDITRCRYLGLAWCITNEFLHLTKSLFTHDKPFVYIPYKQTNKQKNRQFPESRFPITVKIIFLVVT